MTILFLKYKIIEKIRKIVENFNIFMRVILSEKNILHEYFPCTYATDEARTPCFYHRPVLRRNTRIAGTSPLQATCDISFSYILLYAIQVCNWKKVYNLNKRYKYN